MNRGRALALAAVATALFGGSSCGGGHDRSRAGTLGAQHLDGDTPDAGRELAFSLAEVRGDVQVGTPSGFQPVAPQIKSLALGGGARIRTGRGASAVLRAPDGTEIALADGVEISLEEISATVARFALERGKVRAAATPGGRPVAVDSSGAHAEAQGARFTIYAGPRGLVAVAGETGQVRIRARDREVAVGAGQQSIVPPGGVPSDPVAVADDVFLRVSWPTETLKRSPETLVRGRARPGERVLVNGVEAEVRMDGAFETTIRLQEGKNPPLKVEAETLGGRRRTLRGPAVEVKSNLKMQVQPVQWGEAPR